MKRFAVPVLVLMLTITVLFGVSKQKQITSLNKRIKTAEDTMLNGFYIKPSLNYNFELVNDKPSRENIEALAKELLYAKQFFYSIILMNEEKVNERTWQMLLKCVGEEKTVNYILGLSVKGSIDPVDNERLNKIREIYNEFYISIENDTSINGITNINSLAYSYVEFVSKMENLID